MNTNEKYPGYCNGCSPGIIGTCATCFRDIGRPPTNMWYKPHEPRQDRIDTLIRELRYQAENPPKPNLSIIDKAIWEDFAKRCRSIEQELSELGIEI